MNQVNISGNLTDAIGVRKFEQSNVSKFTLAVNDGKEAVFVPVEVWNQEHLAEYLHKGSRALVTGSLKQERWESKDGEKRNRLVLLGRNVEFLDPPPEKMQRERSGKNYRP